MKKQPVCWICFLEHVETRLDADSRCPLHGLIRDRVLGIVRVSETFLHKGAADD